MPPVANKTELAKRSTAEVVALMRTDASRAMAIAKKGVKKHPRYAPLWHALGLSAGHDGLHNDAVRALTRASQLEPGDAAVLTDLCNALRRAGSNDQAILAGKQAVEQAPHLAAARNNYGAALRQAGRVEEAERELRAAVDLAPDVADIHNNLGNVLKTAMRYDDAVTEYRTALKLRPDYAEAMTNLGGTYVEMGLWNEAETICKKALALEPSLPEALRNLGAALYWQGNLPGALKALARASELAPNDPITRKQYALAMIEAGQFSEATELLVEGLKRDRPSPGTPVNDPASAHVTQTKLLHDAQQYLLLRDLGVLGGTPESLLADIDATLRSVPNDRLDAIDLREEGVGSAPRYVNRVLHIEPTEPLAGGALNPAHDYETIAQSFADDGSGVLTIDDVLRPDALEALRRFCERSTIWFQSNFPGELGTSMVNGFATPLIFQIAKDLKQAFPTIFGRHMFQACWAYRYYADQSGLALHTDAATVSMNLWITPDETNLDPQGGGLVFWNKRGPKDFFTKTMAEKNAILEELVSEPGAQSQAVPYRCNRALVFGAGIVHKTDSFSFGTGFHDRRMNVTFLFGPPA